STTWIVWNGHVNALLGGTTVCLYEGNASGRLVDAQGNRLAPDWGVLWRFAAATRSSYFGAGSAFFAASEKAGVRPSDCGDLSALRAVGATGSPLNAESFEWLWRELPRPGGEPVWLSVISGGTDVAAAFVGGVRGLPMVAGQMQAPCLGIDAQSWSEPDAEGRGRPLVDEVGELVIVQPMPSMPLYFWNDPDGRRYRDSYYDMYPGVWRHGDWIRFLPDGQSIIYGRSDATINRQGVRMGTAELEGAVPGAARGPGAGRGADRAHPARDPRGAVAAPRARRGVPGAGHPAHHERQEDGAAGQEAAAGCRRRQRAQARRHGQCRQRRLVRRAGPAPRSGARVGQAAQRRRPDVGRARGRSALRACSSSCRAP
ncbi:MAG: hypothetical protein ACKVQR_01900, partial [Aquabacterium sp.]